MFHQATCCRPDRGEPLHPAAVRRLRLPLRPGPAQHDAADGRGGRGDREPPAGHVHPAVRRGPRLPRSRRPGRRGCGRVGGRARGAAPAPRVPVSLPGPGVTSPGSGPGSRRLETFQIFLR